jgi:hypothetical protein
MINLLTVLVLREVEKSSIVPNYDVDSFIVTMNPGLDPAVALLACCKELGSAKIATKWTTCNHSFWVYSLCFMRHVFFHLNLQIPNTGLLHNISLTIILRCLTCIL